MKSVTKAAIAPPQITLVGHHAIPIGRGEDIRCGFRAFKAAGLPAQIRDVYSLSDPWPEFAPHLTPKLSPQINVFYINGDEVEPVLNHLGGVPAGSYNIVYPAWELSQYPEPWLRQLEKFNEIWAPSRFIQDAIQPHTQTPVLWMPLASQVSLTSFLGRQYFGISEGSYVFLFAFDFLSKVHRKNPFAVLRAFEQLCQSRPQADVQLVLKLNHADRVPEDYAVLMEAVEPFRDRLHIINQTLDDNEIKNLIRCCDCFVSLHRSEGFGRGLAEAMYLGKPTIATNYSGNIDFMDRTTAHLVDYTLIPVESEQYPYGETQHWAEANVEQAAQKMIELVDSPGQGITIGQRASVQVRKQLSYVTVGARHKQQIYEILETSGMLAAS